MIQNIETHKIEKRTSDNAQSNSQTTAQKYQVGIIGCGLIGNKRANALKQFPNSKLIIVADTNLTRAQTLATQYGCEATSDWQKVTQNPAINIVIIATTHDMLEPIILDAIKHNKHILVEKPAGRNPQELARLVDAAKKQPAIKIKVGYNHRNHPAFQKAKEIIATENIGDIMYIRGKYGHGARVGYDKEWRAIKEISGGGEVIDQGSHMIDLARYFMGDFNSAIGCCKTFFWDMEVEDNGFVILSTKDGKIAQFNVSCTQWKNVFQFEIYCRTGQISIDGLGGSYGTETLTFYKMKPEMGPPDKTVFSWESDNSWAKDYELLLSAIESKNQSIQPEGNIFDAYESMKLVYQLYDWSEKQYGKPNLKLPLPKKDQK